jgi:iron-sulfur cluster repair protein YtfE (RIC family)
VHGLNIWYVPTHDGAIGSDGFNPDKDPDRFKRMAEGPISVMEEEHTAVAMALRELRKLTDDYQVPEAACNTWRALWHGLAALEESFHQHIHLENNILFPRALAE